MEIPSSDAPGPGLKWHISGEAKWDSDKEKIWEEKSPDTK